MTTITEFLTARWDEEERRAGMYRTIAESLAAVFGAPDPIAQELFPGMAAQVALARTAERLLADIAAKRAIVALHAARSGECVVCVDQDPAAGGYEFELWPCPTVCLLAQPLAEHPDFDPAWRVG